MSELENNINILNDFVFIYGRVGKENFSPDITYKQVKNYIGVIENDLITELSPRCNLRYSRSNRDYLKVGPDEHVWDEFKKLVRKPCLGIR